MSTSCTSCLKASCPKIFGSTHTIIMSDPGPILPPAKRRRTRKQPPMVEGEDSSLDTAMYMDLEDGRKVLIPVCLDAPPTSTADADAALGSSRLDDENVPNMDTDPLPNRSRKKDRWFYMKEFVSRADGILQAMQTREALSEQTRCAECAESAGKWRCEDCVGGRVLCRKCMRHLHFSNPFHRIECWTGTHFRKAALWEVGVSLILPHQGRKDLCPTLVQQQQLLERLQCRQDDQANQQTYQPILIQQAVSAVADLKEADSATEAKDAEVIRCLDQLLAGQRDEI